MVEAGNFEHKKNLKCAVNVLFHNIFSAKHFFLGIAMNYKLKRMQNDEKIGQFKLNDLISSKIFDDYFWPFILPFIYTIFSLRGPCKNQ